MVSQGGAALQLATVAVVVSQESAVMSQGGAALQLATVRIQ